MQSDPRDETILAGGHRLRARRYAAGRRAPAILLLHEGLGSVSQWRRFPEALAARSGCSVIGYDRYGHGGSEPLSGPRAAGFLDHEAAILPEVMAALGLTEAILLGHSDGGTIALLAAARHPRLVRAVISEAAHVFSEVEAAGGFGAVVQAYESGTLKAGLERHHGAGTEAMFRGWVGVWRSPAMRGWRMTGPLGDVRCPVLALQGDRDDHGSAAQLDAIRDGVAGPVETAMVAGAGHAPHIDDPDGIARLVTAFLDRHVSGG